MKIRIIETIATERACYAAGRVFDLPDAEARIHIRCNHAVEVTDSTPTTDEAAKAEAAQLASARGKPRTVAAGK